MTKVGFTGTRQGMTDKQKAVFRTVIGPMAGQFHFGDCVGADEEAFQIAKEHGRLRTFSHPPVNAEFRAYCAADVILPEAHYMTRNYDIVQVCDVLVAAPAEKKEQLRSGTWSTVRKARHLNKKIIIIEPDGAMSVEE